MQKYLNGLSVLISKGIIFWKCFSFSLLPLSCTLLLLPFFCSSSLAGPTGEQVVSGNITVQRPTSTYTEIQQISDKGIINWQDFSIGIGEHTHFNQPSQSSITLNRVTGSQPSSILGQLTAVGQIILLNRSGVLFGPNATVDVAGLIASTADMTNDDFLSGAYRFSQEAGLSGGIQQQGQITTQEGGYVILVAPHVANSGLIQARLGKVALSSGTEYTVDLQGDQLLQFAVTPSQLTSAVDEKGNPLPQGVFQSGNISASGGTVLMSTQAVHSSINSVISHVGFTEANTLENRNGVIVLSGGPGTTVKVSGAIQAKGQKTGEKGGTIKVLGEKIEVGKTAPAKIDVSGPAGGGKILIGGNLQGKGPEPNAKETTVTNQTELQASTTEKGQGGQIIVYSEGQTTMQGKAEAKGGPEGGSGGFIETSGGTLNIAGAQVNAGAPLGEAGMWLIDPVFNDAIIDADKAAAIVAGLATENVTVQAGSISVQSAINAPSVSNTRWLYFNSGFTVPGSGTIDIQQAITGSFGLQLDAVGTITASAPINVYNFNLNRGTWFQLGTGAGTLPTFNVTNNFAITGICNNSNFCGKFVRLAGGSGSSLDPYLIEDIYGLQGIKNMDLLNFNYSLIQDIDASPTAHWINWDPTQGTGFEPIGSISEFTGTFFGNNHTIVNLSSHGLAISAPAGLFESIYESTIKNLGLINPSISSQQSSAAGFVNNASFSVLDNVYVQGGSITSNLDAAGGIAAFFFNSSLSNAYNTSSIHGQDYVGGLVALVSGSVVGIPTLSKVYNAGRVTGTNNVGGIAGILFFGAPDSINNTVSEAYNFGPVNGVNNVGGLVGDILSGSNLRNVFNAGSVSGNDNVGGLVGNFEDPTGESAIIEHAHNVGAITGTTSNVGAIIGLRFSPGITISDTHWNTDTSGTTDAVGGGGDQTGTTPLTSADMAVQSNFEPPNGTFDFSTTWVMGNMPYLRAGSTYNITNPVQLQLMWANTAGSYQLLNDIDASVTQYWNGGLGFDPVGNDSNPFMGSLAGNNHAISGLTINRSTGPGALTYTGLFGITQFTFIQNLGLINASITGTSNVGGLIGFSLFSYLTNVYNTNGSVNGINNVGGLIGLGDTGSVINSFNTSSVSGNNYIGGIGGYLSDIGVTGSYNAGNVSGINYVGGMVGRYNFISGSAFLVNVFNIGFVAGADYVGGLVGYFNADTLQNAYSAGQVTGTTTNVGTLIGLNTGSNPIDTFWNTETSWNPSNPGIPVAIGGGGSQTGTQGLTIDAMKQSSSFPHFPPTGWDFNNNWNMVEGQTYPFLRWRFAPLYGTSNIYDVPVEIFLNGSSTPYTPTHEFGPSIELNTEGVTSPINGQYYILIDNSTNLSPGDPILVRLNNPSTPVNASTTYNPAGMLVNLIFVPTSPTVRIPPALLPQFPPDYFLAPEDYFPQAEYFIQENYFSEENYFTPWINKVIHQLLSRYKQLKVFYKEDGKETRVLTNPLLEKEK